MKQALIVTVLVALGSLVAGFVFDANSYPIRVLCIVLLTASMGQAWNLVGGFNQISLGHSAFFGIGAYVTTVAQVKFGLNPWLGLPLAMIASVLFALILSVPTMRLKGPYFALATLAAAEACKIAASVMGITGGPQGLSVPFVGDSWAMMQFRYPGTYVPIFVGLFAISSIVFAWLVSSRVGYFLRAVRDNELAAEVAGVATFKTKLFSSIVSAALMAVCGVLFAQFTYFIDPETVFSIPNVSIRAALVVIIGGVGTLVGPLFGALLIIPLEELLNASLSDSVGGLPPLLFGALLIVVVLLKPAGLTSIRVPRMGGRKS